MDKESLNKLREIADSELRGFLIRKSEKNEFGKIFCPITKKWMREKDLHVCHIEDRARMVNRYNPANVFLGSKNSNLFESKEMVAGFKSVHHKKIEEEFGKDLVEYLTELSKERVVYTRDDYIDLITFFKEG